MGHIIPLAFTGRGSLFFRQFSRNFLGQFRILVPVQLHPHDQKALNPRLELEALNPPRVEVNHHLFKDVLGHTLAILVVGHLPQSRQLVHDVQAHTQFQRNLLRLGRARLPVGYLALVLLLACQILLTTQITIQKQVLRRLDAPATERNRFVALSLKLFLVIRNAAVFGLDGKFGHQVNRFLVDG